MGNKLCDLTNLMTRDSVKTLYDRYKGFFGYCEGVPYARVVDLFGETAANAGKQIATVLIVPAIQPDEEDVHFIFYPLSAFYLAATRANVETELRRIHRRDTEECEDTEEGEG